MVYPYSKFEYITDLIIDNLEGGYYHPDFYITGRKRYGDNAFITANNFVKSGYRSSGETMFGLDRDAGWNMWYKSSKKTTNVQNNLKYIYSGVYQFIDNDAKTFWTTLDRLDARHKWLWGYPGGEYRKMLKDLCVKMMYNYFNRAVWSKLTDKGKLLVLNDNKLAFNYIYSAWNGPVYSNFYNKIFNTEIERGVNDSTSINNTILNARANSSSGLIRDSATKIKKVLPKIKNTTTTTQPVEEKKKTGKNVFLGGLVSVLIILIIIKTKK